MSNITGPGNHLVLIEILSATDGLHHCAAILHLNAEVPKMYGPLSWVHGRINNSVVVRRDNASITGMAAMLTRNDKNYAYKSNDKFPTFHGEPELGIHRLHSLLNGIELPLCSCAHHLHRRASDLLTAYSCREQNL